MARFLLSVLLAALVAGCAPSRDLVGVVAAAHPGAVFSVPACSRVVALTLDDGPDPRHTPAVLDVLARHGARATFFVVGERVEAHPEVVARAVAEGHELGLHGWTRDPALLLGSARTVRDLDRLAPLVEGFGPVRWVRPSVGFYTPAIRRAAEARGWRLALGSVYPNDSWVPWTPWLAQAVLRDVRPGGVIVLHDGLGARTRAAAVLDRVLPALARRGYRVTTLSDLVDTARPCPADGPRPDTAD